MSSEFPERTTLLKRAAGVLRAGAGRLRRRWHAQTLGLRLVAGYALLFILSVAVLAVLAYGLLIYFLQQPDRGFMEAQARELAAAYRQGGAEALQEALAGGASDERRQELVVRLADAQGRTLLLYNPDNWRPSELALLERQPPPETQAWIPLGTAEDEDPLAAVALRLAEDRVLQVGMDAALREDVLESMETVFLVIALPVVLLALLGGALLAYRALRPVRRLVETFHAIIETGDVEMRVPPEDARGEFAELVHLFNRMLGRIERLVGRMRETLDAVAHDLRTPMTRLRGRAEQALQQQEAGPAALRAALADTLEASEAVLELMDTMMDVAEAEAGALRLRPGRVPVADLAEGVVEAYRLVADDKGVTLDVRIPAGLHVVADRRRMQQVVANLLDNAIKYTAPGGQVVLSACEEEGACEEESAAEERRSGRSVRIEVQDDGIGIPAEEQPRIWDRLYRSDRSRSERGLGLGLSLVRAIVEAHGGRVHVESAPGDGTTFTVRLPRTGEPRARARSAADG